MFCLVVCHLAAAIRLHLAGSNYIGHSIANRFRCLILCKNTGLKYSVVALSQVARISKLTLVQFILAHVLHFNLNFNLDFCLFLKIHNVHSVRSANTKIQYLFIIQCFLRFAFGFLAYKQSNTSSSSGTQEKLKIEKIILTSSKNNSFIV